MHPSPRLDDSAIAHQTQALIEGYLAVDPGATRRVSPGWAELIAACNSELTLMVAALAVEAISRAA